MKGCRALAGGSVYEYDPPLPLLTSPNSEVIAGELWLGHLSRQVDVPNAPAPAPAHVPAHPSTPSRLRLRLPAPLHLHKQQGSDCSTGLYGSIFFCLFLRLVFTGCYVERFVVCKPYAGVAVWNAEQTLIHHMPLQTASTLIERREC